MATSQVELQHFPTNHHRLQPGEPRNSTSPRDPNSSLSLSSSTLSSTTIPSPPKIPINASHYSDLLNNNTHGFDGVNLADLVVLKSNSTILHLAASTGQLEFINMIIQQSSSLLQHKDCNGDLPLHVAAKACQSEAVEMLVHWALQSGEISMLESKNNENNTALHIALENQQHKMAKCLYENCPQTFYNLNNQRISPLFLAIKAEFWELVTTMLRGLEDEQSSDAETQLSHGISVVHAAIIAKKIDILERMSSELILYKTDELRRTPLSYAAYTGFVDGVKYIINKYEFRNQAFKIDEKGLFPIHYACKGGNVRVVKEFFSHLPDKTRLLLTNKGQNILHVAAADGKAEVLKFILRHSELEFMINMKDEDGNTPLHLATKRKHPKVVYILSWDDRVNLRLQNKECSTALDIVEKNDHCTDNLPSFEERLTWLSLRYAGVPRAPQLHYPNINHIGSHMPTTSSYNSQPQEPHIYNNDNISTMFLVQDQQRNLVKNFPNNKRKIKYNDRTNTLLVVATLVATVTFAAGFSIPGGFKNETPHEGMAILAHKHAFQVFTISNTIAMYSAILAAVTLIWAHLDDLRLVLLSLDFAVPLLGTSLAMMSVAFMAGSYVVLHTLVFWLGIVVLVMGGVFLGALLLFFIPLYSPTSCVRNKILRYVFHLPFTILLLACEKGKTRTHD